MEMENSNTTTNNIEVSATENKTADASDNAKMYTKDEVTEIVNKAIRKRLAREKEKTSEPGIDEAALKARSAKLDCREYVIENGLSKDLLDVIDTSDFEVFKAKAEKIGSIISAKVEENAAASYPEIVDRGEGDHRVSRMLSNYEPDISKAFSKDATKHKPKEFNPYG